MKDWDYAKLTHEAAQAGGVEEYVAMIRQAGFSDGKSSMYPWIPVAVGAGWLLKLLIDKAVDAYCEWKEERERLKNDGEMATERLVNMCATHQPNEGEEIVSG